MQPTQSAASDDGASVARPPLDEATLEWLRQVFQYARSGDAAHLEPLLAQGLPPNLRNERGDTLLMLAAYHGHLDAVRVLLEHGADPEIMNDASQSPLHGAAFKGDLAITTLLLERGAKPDNAGPSGRTALMFAAMFNRTEILQLLMDRGADPAARDAGGVSALDAARRMGADDTAAMLATYE